MPSSSPRRLRAIAQKQIDKSSPIIARFDTQITDINFSGTASVPFGPNNQLVDVNVTATRATDHNSSRSNKSSSVAAPDDGGGDADDFDGLTAELFSTFDVKFDLTIEDIDPVLDFDFDIFGQGPLVGALDGPATLEAPAVPLTFDGNAPDLGMLAGRAVDHRGHVTVLKIAFGGGGGGGGEVDILRDAISLSLDQGGGQFTPQANGDVLHEASGTLGISALYQGIAFDISGLTGTITEVGQFSVQAVPEPGGFGPNHTGDRWPRDPPASVRR